MIFSKFGIGIGGRLVEKLAARLVREARIKRKAYQKGHEAGLKIGIAEGHTKARKELGL